MNDNMTQGTRSTICMLIGLLICFRTAAAGDGFVATDFFGDQDSANHGVITPDGKLISVGGARSVNANGAVMAATRHLEDGTLDPTFGTGGKTWVANRKTDSDVAQAAALQQNGKIVLGGNRNSGSNWIIARLNVNGSLDTSFASRGVFVKSIHKNGARLETISVQPDDKILAIGHYSPDRYVRRGVILRLTASGSVDKSFGKDGLVFPNLDARSWRLLGATLHAEKILVCGQAFFADRPGSDLILMRLNANGSLDSTFGTGGIVVADFQLQDCAEEVAINADGQILVAATFESDPEASEFHYWSGVVCFEADGSPNVDFGEAGVAQAPEAADNLNPWEMAIQPDGCIVLAGNGYYGSRNTVITRFTADGLLDVLFGDNGWVIDPAGAANDVQIAVYLGDDEPITKIVVIGNHWATESNTSDFFAARYLDDGTPDVTFGD
jgi:uncharacterized delta-60 repeat protein